MSMKPGPTPNWGKANRSQPLLYGLASLSLFVTIYATLDNVAVEGISRLQPDEFLEVWPVTVLLVSAPLYLLSAAVSLVRPKRAAKVAIIAASCAFPFLGFLLCVFSFALLTHWKLVLVVILPSALVTESSYYSIRLLRSAR